MIDVIKKMFNRKTAFTLAETLVVIGIIGVVAALTLPNLNKSTGDQERITRIKKTYASLVEAHRRLVADYKIPSKWPNDCKQDINYCWMQRIGNYLRISAKCDARQGDDCSMLSSGDNWAYDGIIYQMPDGMTLASYGSMSMTGFPIPNCTEVEMFSQYFSITDLCLGILVDIDGPQKGKNRWDDDIFFFILSNKGGISTLKFGSSNQEAAMGCANGSMLSDQLGMDPSAVLCTWWPLEIGNMDIFKTQNGVCLDNQSIMLDGVNNTTCH